ncbi:hypothetical protein Tcan_01952 [Toxocara canis]|uniref:Uncharacterized protein n=2 Tax=Toxocara canis TaxID=6265 RepID=A0A0B2VYI8_TOXCA|nr:hypothetical protein Tcan_01952 [Toxocara canis]VDM45977.1 unnamed protein product [Toxocara canis]
MISNEKARKAILSTCSPEKKSGALEQIRLEYVCPKSQIIIVESSSSDNVNNSLPLRNGLQRASPVEGQNGSMDETLRRAEMTTPLRELVDVEVTLC